MSRTVIRTVRGDIAPADLGVTASHEHLWCDQHLCRDADFPAHGEKMRLRDMDMVVDEAGRFRTAGGGAIVEVTVHGWGRDMDALARVSSRTGLHVIATAGFYIESCHPAFVAGSSCSELADFLIGEVSRGADGTGRRCGLLKGAVGGARIGGAEEKCIRAVARAHLATGAAITTHTSAGSRFQIDGGNAGTMFLDLFEDEGVDPARVIIGHCDENADVRQLSRLLERGAWVQFDVIGKEHWLLDTTRADLLADLIGRGHSRLLLSGDRNRLSEMHCNGGKGYDYLLTHFVPLLKSRGLAETEIERMLVTNPAAIFAMPADPPEKELP
jgi:phosphotriesterase-related protein